jgi:hypothetical protein
MVRTLTTIDRSDRTRADDKVSRKTVLSFERVDQLNPALRECVHEFGEVTVNACLFAGVRDPRKIRQLIREIWEGARQPTQRRPALGNLDWVLMQAGARISAKTLIRILRDNHHYLVPLDPTTPMLEASMNTIATFDARITKREKHRRRLRAAIEVGARHIWPDV